MKTAALVLAAGASTRLGQPKQLVLLQGETLLERALRLACKAGCEPVIAVLGAHAGKIEAVVSFDGIHVVHNPAWQEGMASSIRAGLHDLVMGRAERLLVMACDQPSVTAGHLQALLQQEEGIVASGYAGRRGIPAVFPRSMFGDLMHLRGDAGARDLLRGESVTLIDLPEGELDIDTPADLARLSQI